MAYTYHVYGYLRGSTCAAALWSYKRDFCMPEGSRQGATEGAMLYRYPAGARPGFVSAGDWLRITFRREYGRTIAGRWFD